MNETELLDIMDMMSNIVDALPELAQEHPVIRGSKAFIKMTAMRNKLINHMTTTTAKYQVNPRSRKSD